MNREKLLEVLESYDVAITSKGNICLNDFVQNIIQSKNPDLYIKKIDDTKKIIRHDEYYIKPETCYEILGKTNFKQCKEIMTKIQLNDDETIIDVENEIFKFEGHKFMAFFIVNRMGDYEDVEDSENDIFDWEVWLKGSEVARYLGYKDTERAIQLHVEEKNKTSFKKLKKLFGSVKNPGMIMGQKNIDHKTIFINLSGLTQLLCCSRKPVALRMTKMLQSRFKIITFYKKTAHETHVLNNLSRFFDSSKISYLYQYYVKCGKNKYLIDCYLPDYKIAIEIDENNHNDRDKKYELKREEKIKKILGCKFIRCNPDDEKFNLYEFIGKINAMVINY